MATASPIAHCLRPTADALAFALVIAVMILRASCR